MRRMTHRFLIWSIRSENNSLKFPWDIHMKISLELGIKLKGSQCIDGGSFSK